MAEKTSLVLMDEQDIDRVLTRMAHQILERNKGTNKLVLIGILTGGAFLAKRLREKIKIIEGAEVLTGILDISLYRDDWSMLGHRPVVRKTEINFSIEEKNVVLVDDVLYTGRTVRAALDALMDLGRPKRIELAILVDRGHRELPIEPQYAGKTLQTASSERINVYLKEMGGPDSVMLEK